MADDVTVDYYGLGDDVMSVYKVSSAGVEIRSFSKY